MSSELKPEDFSGPIYDAIISKDRSQILMRFENAIIAANNLIEYCQEDNYSKELTRVFVEYRDWMVEKSTTMPEGELSAEFVEDLSQQYYEFQCKLCKHDAELRQMDKDAENDPFDETEL
jgi:hypothetical protein